MFSELLLKNRSVRRYDTAAGYPDNFFSEMAEVVRLCPSTANLQRIRILPVTAHDMKEKVFNSVKFASMLDWSGPAESERPACYAVLVCEGALDTNKSIDVGIIAQSMLLRAREMGMAGCMFRSFNADSLAAALGLKAYTPALVISFGYPSEKVEVVDAKDGSLKYYRNNGDTHCVPKLKAEEFILNE